MKHFFIAALLAITSSAWAQVTVSVEEARVRGTVPQQQATGAFMRLTANQAVRLVEASSPVAGTTEIHEMTMDNGVMRMRQIPGLDLPAGQTVELRPGGYHVMLLNLRQQLEAGQTVPITLVFVDANQRRFIQQIEAPVRAPGTGHGHGHGHGGPRQ